MIGSLKKWFLSAGDGPALARHICKGALAGFILAGVLAATSGVLPGEAPSHAGRELLHHSLYIHPLLWVGVGFVVCALVSAQAGQVLNWLDIWIGEPLLQLFAHLFSVGFGALVVLKIMPLSPEQGEVVGLCGWSSAITGFVEFFVLFVMAIVSTAGLLIVRGRVEERAAAAVDAAGAGSGTAVPGETLALHASQLNAGAGASAAQSITKSAGATPAQLVGFSFLAVALLFFGLYLTNMKHSTEENFGAAIGKVNTAVCRP